MGVLDRLILRDEQWERIPADFVMADTAYDNDRLCGAIADNGAVAVISNSPFLRAKISAGQASLCPEPPARVLLVLETQVVPQGRYAKNRRGHQFAATPCVGSGLL
ncbi:hypothetical protein AM571_PA00001 (plasmid) [Rhizobium etli 8C-3]|uniref:Uncharacterized protein n=1 Tax=Rhizobium etli 8C-3 TaxID=538025 RepID=A0A1L5P9P9_RHIET|nr:hypothetical protein AM571_PA00001 [Rhizobium etli 8C-3]